jgi:ABC-type enterochelin transport system permease subunit
MAERELTRGQLPFSNIAMPNFKGFFVGDFIKERMRFSTILGSSS